MLMNNNDCKKILKLFLIFVKFYPYLLYFILFYNILNKTFYFIINESIIIYYIKKYRYNNKIKIE